MELSAWPWSETRDDQTTATDVASKEAMKPLTAAVAAVLVAALAQPALAQLTKEAAIAKAETILKHLQEGKAADVVKEFDARMAQDVPESKLQDGFAALATKFGAFKTVSERREGLVKDRQTVELILVFEKETIVERVAFDSAGKVSGLGFRPLSTAQLPPVK